MSNNKNAPTGDNYKKARNRLIHQGYIQGYEVSWLSRMFNLTRQRIHQILIVEGAATFDKYPALQEMHEGDGNLSDYMHKFKSRIKD